MSRVLVTGVTGQDGALAARQLIEMGHLVVGTFRRHSSEAAWRLDEMGLLEQIELLEWRLDDPLSIMTLIEEARPEALLHFAAESFSQDSVKQPGVPLAANTLGTTYLLEAVRRMAPECRVVHASSSEIFVRKDEDQVCNEATSTQPVNAYGVSKLAASHMARIYREHHGLSVSNAILFNHEGPYRGHQFVTRKISLGVARIAFDPQSPPLRLGNLDARRDWGSASEFVDAMIQMLNLEPSDYVLGTGVLFSVRQLLVAACTAAGIDGQFQVVDGVEHYVDRGTGRTIALSHPSSARVEPKGTIRANSQKFSSQCGWRASTLAPSLMDEMLAADLRRLELGKLPEG